MVCSAARADPMVKLERNAPRRDAAGGETTQKRR
jgi:hypothetical protein